jgi:hypothetical protein
MGHLSGNSQYSFGKLCRWLWFGFTFAVTEKQTAWISSFAFP